ncbi:MAG: type II CAAX endopeptidase family protein [bacterium]
MGSEPTPAASVIGQWLSQTDMPLEPLLAGGLALLFLAACGVTGRLVCLRDEFPNWPRRLIALGAFWAILVATVFYATVSPGDATDIDTETLWFPTLFAGHVLLCVFLVIWWRLAWPQPFLRFIHLETAAPSDIPLGLRVGMVGWLMALVTSGVVAVVLASLGWDGGADTGGVVKESFQVPPLLLWLAGLPLSRKLLVVFVAMTVEEGFYRGFLQPRIGWIPSSILFALSHAGYGLPTLMASVFAISLAIGWAFKRTGSLLPCIVAHGLFDAVQLLVIMPLAIDRLQSGG